VVSNSALPNLVKFDNKPERLDLYPLTLTISPLSYPIAMKLLLDQGLPLSAAALLRDVSIEIIHVGEIGMSQAEDAEIIQKARVKEPVVVKLDANLDVCMKFFSILMLKRLMSMLTKPSRRKLPDVWSRSEQTPRLHPNIKALKGDYAGYYRYRIGDYRVIYSINDEVVQVLVVAIANRSEAYEP
jgi:mRNA interferase RelE/StbE